jgi:hypothetical protein
MKVRILILLFLAFFIGCQPQSFNVLFNSNGVWEPELKLNENDITMSITGQYVPTKEADNICLKFNIEAPEEIILSLGKEKIRIESNAFTIVECKQDNKLRNICRAELQITNDRADLGLFTYKGYLSYLESTTVKIAVIDIFNRAKTFEIKMCCDDLQENWKGNPNKMFASSN